MYASGLGKVDNRICMVLEWTLGLPTPGSIFSAAVTSVSLHLKGTWETQNHQAFCVSLVPHYNLQSCMFIFSETLHDQSFSHI